MSRGCKASANARCILMTSVLVLAGCRSVEPRPPSAVAVEPERSPSSAQASGAVWTATPTAESSLGPLDCYSQAALDDCAARARPAPEGACEQIGAVQTSVVQAGMACTDCVTDCWCRATTVTTVCK
jgi:hypothetical protein